MRQRINKILLSCLLVFTFILTGCSSDSNKIYDFDAQELAGKIAEAVQFDDSLDVMETSKAVHQYNADDIQFKSACIYMSSVATSEEIAVFVCENEEDAEKTLNLCNDRISAQEEIYKSYAPKEVKRLENSCVIKKNNVVVLCVSNSSDTVKTTVDDFFKNLK